MNILLFTTRLLLIRVWVRPRKRYVLRFLVTSKLKHCGIAILLYHILPNKCTGHGGRKQTLIHIWSQYPYLISMKIIVWTEPMNTSTISTANVIEIDPGVCEIWPGKVETWGCLFKQAGLFCKVWYLVNSWTNILSGEGRFCSYHTSIFVDTWKLDTVRPSG